MKRLLNPARERLESGNISIGIGIRIVRTNEIAPLMKTAGMDWLFIDLEHGPLTLDQTAQISVTSLASGIAPIVRVPRGEMAMATRALDGGALGIVNPMCESASEARDIVEKLHYPPEGQRSVVGGLPQYNYGSTSIADSTEGMNEAMLVIVMLETPNAIAHADEIAGVDGIDIILIGTNDLAASSGIPGEVGHERIAGYYETVAKACKKHGKWMGMGGVPQPDLQEKYINMGVRFLLAGQDLTYLLGAAKITVDRVNTYL